MENTFRKLRRFNIIMGALHLVQGIIMLILATQCNSKNIRICSANQAVLHNL